MLGRHAVNSAPRSGAAGKSAPAGHRAPTALLASLVVWVCVASAPAAAGQADAVEIGQPLRDVTMSGLNGPARRLSAFRGKPLIVNVWASWCGPCREEMASLERLAWQDRSVPFSIIGISTDDYPDKARRLLEATHATISHFIDNKLVLETMLGATHLPLTVFVDAKGRVVGRVYGARQWDSAQSKALIGDAFRSRGAAPGP